MAAAGALVAGAGIKVASGVIGVAAKELYDDVDTKRSIKIQIENKTAKHCLIDPRVYFKHGTANKIIPRRIEHSGNPNNVGLYKVRRSRMPFPLGGKVNGILMYRISEKITAEKRFDEQETAEKSLEKVAVQDSDNVIKQGSDRQEIAFKQGLDTQEIVAEISLDGQEIMIEKCQDRPTRDRHKGIADEDLETLETEFAEKDQDTQEITVEDRQEATASDNCEIKTLKYIGIYFKIPLDNYLTGKNKYDIKIYEQANLQEKFGKSDVDDCKDINFLVRARDDLAKGSKKANNSHNYFNLEGSKFKVHVCMKTATKSELYIEILDQEDEGD